MSQQTQDESAPARPVLAEDERVEPYLIDAENAKITVRSVRASSAGGPRTEIQVREFPIFVTDEPLQSAGTDTGPTPLEMTLAALLGCENVMINGVSSVMKFEYEGVDLEADGQFDLRGPRGVPGIHPYFEWVDVRIKVYTSESDERFEQLKRNVESRCPVLNLMRDSGCRVTVDWTKA